VTRGVCFTFFCFILFADTAQASQQDDLERLHKRIGNLQQELEKAGESKSEAADALRDSERAISTSSRKLNELAHHQVEANRALNQLNGQSRQLEHDMQTEQNLLSRLLYQQYLGGKQEFLKLLLDSRDPNQTARELQYFEYIARSRAAWLKTLRDKLQRLQSLTAQARIKSREIATLQADERTQRQHLESDKRIRQQTLVKIAHQMKQQRREIGRLQRDENRLSHLVDKLAHMLSQPKGSIAFKSLKRRLQLPVKGKPDNKFGSPRPDSNVLWKGWFLRAETNQPVRAIASGSVVYADWLRGFGNLMIVDHGDGYMSLYGNNETLYKQVGEEIRGGDTIADVGNSGGNEDSGLYFELRHEGKPLDPAQWISRK
jgi:septal ring factor EnvC (AmiA/AmiB activator)